MKIENIILEKKENIAFITINRPKALNALNTQTIGELDIVIDDIKNDDEIYVVILKGSGEKAFVAGADIVEMSNLSSQEARRNSIFANTVFRKLENLEKPVIAAINGFALGGGCELAMCCDIRIASKNAKIGQPEVGLGITPGFGGTQRLTRLVGMGIAKELIYTGKMIDADEAYRIGLVNSVVESDKLMDESIKIANEIKKQAPIAVRLCKAAINRGAQCDIDTALSYESDVFGLCFATEDQKEGMNAFMEKREKSFKNK